MQAISYLSNPVEENTIRPLLEFLAEGEPPQHKHWQGWHITHITGGWCNLLYRATSSRHDLAIKFVIRDTRDRAGREYDALLALRQAGLSVAPAPLWLDRDSYAQPVVVQSWLEGQACTTPPTANSTWQGLLSHLAVVHSVTPDKTSLELHQGVIDASSAEQGKKLIHAQVAVLPPEARPDSLQVMVDRLENTSFPDWAPPALSLCRVDNNIQNFIRQNGKWASVDWENAGWGDPAFEIAELMTHPAYLGTPPTRWEWVIDAYTRLMGDACTALRIRVYHRILAVWWMARMARYLYEFPRDLDKRLVDYPAGWETDRKAKYQHYLALAENLL